MNRAAPDAPENGWRSRSDVHTAFLPPEAVLFDELTGSVHRLNGGASSVWLLLDGQSTSTELAHELAEIYGADPTTMLDQVDAALGEFREHGLLEGFPPPPAPPELRSEGAPTVMLPPPNP